MFKTLFRHVTSKIHSYLTFDIFCDTESHYDGIYVIIDDNNFYMKWNSVFNEESEYGYSGAVNVDNCWVFSGVVGWTYNC